MLKALRNAKSKAKPRPGPKAHPSSTPSQQAQSDSESSKANQHQQYTIFKKVQLIKNLHAEAERNPFASNSVVARNCGVHPRTAADLLQNEDEIHRLANALSPAAAKVFTR
ncbi:hypothetical protein BGZ50_001255 [Haplosporangium sp. Z 11]|nr:hypothetical protein BGZ50_001255 [Haplosporangium sp. Z 11]